jgi:hypothetical protein
MVINARSGISDGTKADLRRRWNQLDWQVFSRDQPYSEKKETRTGVAAAREMAVQGRV